MDKNEELNSTKIIILNEKELKKYKNQYKKYIIKNIIPMKIWLAFWLLIIFVSVNNGNARDIIGENFLTGFLPVWLGFWLILVFI